MDERETLLGVLSAEGTLSGTLTPAAVSDYTENYATDEECVAVIDNIFQQLEKGE